MKSSFTFITPVAAMFLNFFAVAAENHPVTGMDAHEALAQLKMGNQRFSDHPRSEGKPSGEKRAETAESQHPLATVVGCADSRTSPELLFDQNIGDLFVVRTAGNLVDDYALGSIEYAVEHLGVRLIVVLGHERCGAVKAALESDTAPGHIGALVKDIQPAVQAAAKQPGDRLANTIHANAADVAEKIKNLAQFGDLVSQVRIVTGYYDLDTGVVEWPED